MSGRNALDDVFENARNKGRAVLIPYLTAGFPDPARFVDLAVAILDAGADILELGIPFSDPLLDGPSIQHSSQRALDSGVTPPMCIEYARQIHARSDKPLLFMSPYNPLLAYGLDHFCRDSSQAGLTGLIITDVPMEEQGDLLEAAGHHHLHVIQLLAPTSTPERLRHAAAIASGFIYCISVAGVTGARSGIAEAARPLVAAVKRLTDVPVAVGFGISSPEAARQVAQFADGVIVGSALINLLTDASSEEQIPHASSFMQSLRDALTSIHVA
ncbi:MAG: tryptophan synthase subunit alpha [Chloroflexota bacterium]|nr:tryptophan synthase subunit alpha [Chloroflexota bacterium]